MHTWQHFHRERKKNNKHKDFGRDGVWDKSEPPLGQTGPWDKPGPVPAKNRPSLVEFHSQNAILSRLSLGRVGVVWDDSPTRAVRQMLMFLCLLFFLGGGLFHLRLGLFYLRLVFVTYGGLFCLRLKFGLVFFAYGGKSVWSFLLTVPPVQKIGFGLFCLQFPHRKQKRRTVSKKTSTVSKKDASFFFAFVWKLSVHSKYGWNGMVSSAFPHIALISTSGVAQHGH